MIDNLLIEVYSFAYAYIDIAFCRWDIATEVYELVYWIQRLAI